MKVVRINITLNSLGITNKINDMKTKLNTKTIKKTESAIVRPLIEKSVNWWLIKEKSTPLKSIVFSSAQS